MDLACHEGYPGHHVYNTLLEKHLVKDRGWMEFTVYPLFSPQSLIAEGTANYGIPVTFPDDERIAFEEKVLFPAAGLDPARVREYYEVAERWLKSWRMPATKRRAVTSTRRSTPRRRPRGWSVSH